MKLKSSTFYRIDSINIRNPPEVNNYVMNIIINCVLGLGLSAASPVE